MSPCHRLGNSEKDRADVCQDAIAIAMWEDYVAYTAGQARKQHNRVLSKHRFYCLPEAEDDYIYI